MTLKTAPSAKTSNSDFLIIGGGIAGISAAARLSGDASVTVLEMEASIGYHSSGRSAAMIIRNYGNATLRALNLASFPFLENPVGVSDTGLLSPRGELMVANELELPDLHAYLDGSSGVETLSAQQAAEIVPILRADQIAGAAIEWDAQEIDVDRMLQGFARMLRGNDGQIVNTAAMEISRKNGIWHVVTKQGEFSAPVLINAAGGWADTIARMAQVTPKGIQPMRRSAALIPPPDGHDISKWPLFVSAAESWYAKPESGQLMVSPADEDHVEPHDVWAEDMVLAEGIERYQQMVTTPVTRITHTWAGMRSFAPDRTLVVGFAPDADGFFWLAGQGGYGIQTAPAVSELVADLCLGREVGLSAEVVTALDAGREGLKP
ncbi:MAG: FAD-binding oxidoreductase [Rhodobacteraceae bacterium]|nr:FAD-binding oxidoreductase [Paracoccaceae bacterium]